MLSNSKIFSLKFQGWSFGLSLITFIVLTASLIATSFWIYFIGSHYKLLSHLKLFVWTIVIWLINWNMIKSNTLVNHFSRHVWNSFKLITQMYPKYKQLIQWISLFQDNTETVKKFFFVCVVLRIESKDFWLNDLCNPLLFYFAAGSKT